MMWTILIIVWSKIYQSLYLIFQDKTSGKTPLMYAIEKRDPELVEQFLSLFESNKLCKIIKSETFEGNSCLKIAEGLKHEFIADQWQKMWNTLNAGINGDAPRRQHNMNMARSWVISLHLCVFKSSLPCLMKCISHADIDKCRSNLPRLTCHWWVVHLDTWNVSVLGDS